jgi:membrane protein
LSAAEISDELEIPIRLVRDILFELTETGILTEVIDADLRQRVYQPARDIADLSIASVLEAMARQGTSNVPVTSTPELKKVIESLKNFEEQIKKSSANKLLVEL